MAKPASRWQLVSRMHACRQIFSSGFFLLALAALVQAESQKLTGEIASVRGYFSDIRSVYFRLSGVKTVLQGDSAGETSRLTSEMWSTRDSFKYRATQDTGGKDSDGEVIVAYDGTTHQMLLDGQLEMSKKQAMGDFFLDERLGVFEPFVPFMEDLSSDKRSILPKLSDFTTEATWSQSLKNVESVGSKTIDRYDCFALKLPSGRFFGQKSSIATVYLAKSLKFYPVGWDWVTNDGRAKKTFRVEELGDAVAPGNPSIKYPKRFQTTVYHSGSETPWYKIDYELEAVEFNKDIPAEEFMIDPASARLIYDADEAVFINLPK